MAPRRTDLSGAEWELMKTIWNLPQPVTVRTVLTTTYPNDEKAYTTVQTLMNILVEKEFLSRHKTDNRNRYTVMVDRETVVGSSIKKLATQMFGGSVGALASYLVDTDHLSAEELNELRDILKVKKGGRK